MKEFFSQYGFIFLQSIMTLVVLIISILKKKVVVKDFAFKLLLEALPRFIKFAEEKFDRGETKKAFVMSSSISYLSDLLEKDPLEVNKIYYQKVSEAIEKILSTPQKKGVNND